MPSSSVLTHILTAFDNIDQNGQTVILCGISGIGKSYHSKKFIDLIRDEIYLINVNGLFVEQSSYSTINSAVYKHISEQLVDKEITFNLLQKLAAGIPRFGQYISHFFDTNKEHDALINLVKKSGINPNEPNVFNIIGFFDSLAKGKKVVMYCDNIQWFDKESWRLLIKLTAATTDHRWLCLLNYTTNAEITQLNHYDFVGTINQMRLGDYVTVLNIETFPQDQIQSFCQETLGIPILISPEQWTTIYEFSKGVPYYLKTVLQLLKENGQLKRVEQQWVGQGNWQSEQLRMVLKDCVKERVTDIYRKIPGSRDTLELASVFGEEFQEDSINALFELQDSFSLLSSIESKFRLIQYLADERSWMFEHSLVHSYIYQSIGVKAKSLHLKIARYLEGINSDNYIKIAAHFQQAGEQEAATLYQLKEAEQLLQSGCYNAAADLIDNVAQDWLAIFSLSELQKQNFEILKGKAKFHTVQYEAAIEIFTAMLFDDTASAETKALCHRWLGRSYSKLNRQSDFQTGLDHLETARAVFEDLNMFEDLGFVYADLVVAYAHLNRINDAEAAFKRAEHFFNRTKNKLGMLRLQRRTVIFMEPKLSAKLLETTGNILKNMNLPNEQIMTFNNAATQFIYSGDLEKAKSLLLESLTVSINIGGFGQVYLYNNLGMINYIENNIEDATHCFSCGRSGRYRHVEQLIIDINESAVLSKKLPIEGLVVIFNRIYQKALEVGENDYIVPAGLNLAKATGRNGGWQMSIDLLLEIEESVKELNSDYSTFMWYSSIRECLDNGMVAPAGFSASIQPIWDLNNPIYNSDFSLISMQFWSDN